MKKILFCFLICLLGFISCQTLYTYRLPNETERTRFADSLLWGYSGSTISSIPVVDGNGSIFRLAVAPKTKIEVKTVEGVIYRFYLQTVKISGDDGFLGTSKTWSGYDLFNHTTVTVLVHEVNTMTILSDEKAFIPIAIR